MITQKSIDRILNMTHIEDVIGDFVPLRKAGANYKGCCPFHDEKTPSFVVSPAIGLYKCFGCGKAGNVITFLKEKEKLSYAEAIKYLGNKYHVEVVETELTPEEKEKRDVRESLQIVNKFAAEWFEKTLWESEEGKSVGLAYFMERGFTEVSIPDSITEIGINAFGGCKKLTHIVIPNSITKIEDISFANCTGLTEISIPDSVTEIGNWAFKWCESLTHITISNSVKKIGYSAFAECKNLTTISIPDSVTEIDERAFEGCEKLDLPDWVKKLCKNK